MVLNIEYIVASFAIMICTVELTGNFLFFWTVKVMLLGQAKSCLDGFDRLEINNFCKA